jgi:hypothetical protein
MFCAWL